MAPTRVPGIVAITIISINIFPIINLSITINIIIIIIGAGNTRHSYIISTTDLLLLWVSIKQWSPEVCSEALSVEGF